MKPASDDSQIKRMTGVFAIIIAAGLILANANSIYGLLAASLSFRSTAIIKSPNIGVYQEKECLTETASVEWGLLEPGDQVSRTCYINNTGNIPLSLHITTEEWNPENANVYLNLAWNCTGTRMEPGEIISANITLTVSESIEDITSFSFNILIIGTEIID